MKKIETLAEPTTIEVQIKPPAWQIAQFHIRGTAPLVMHRFSKKAMQIMIDRQKSGSRATKGQARLPKNFNECYEEAKHVSKEGWCGIPASAFRKAMISACRLCGFKMTLAKMALFVIADGYDADGATPLVKILTGEPKEFIAPARNDNGGCDIRIRPKWDEWTARVRIRYDSDIFSLPDVTNLLNRVGSQVGLLEGRPDSRDTPGMEWGMFEIEESKN